MHRVTSVAVVASWGVFVGIVTVVPAATPASGATGTYRRTEAVSIGQASTTAGGGAVTVSSEGAASPYPSSASVSGLVGAVSDVNVTLLGFSHATPDDVDVMLVSPGGKRAVVLSDAGGDTDAGGLDVVLDDQAAQALPDTSALATGTYRPADYEVGDTFAAPADASGTGSALSVFNDSSPNGTWQLFVMDDRATDAGSLTSWRLEVTTTGPQPYPSSLTVSGAADRITDVNVVLTGFTHTSPSDVDILLVGPGGQQAMIMSDVGGDADASGLEVVLDDDASSQVPTPLVTGTYQPTNAGSGDSFPAPAPAAAGTTELSVFEGTDPNGTWRLYVADDAAGDTGSLTGGWGLVISAVDTIAPRVSSVKPVAGSRNVRRGANIRITFSERIRPLTLNRDTVYLLVARTDQRVRVAVRHDNETLTTTLNPRSTLRAGTKYRVVVTTKVKDQSGNRLDQNAGLTGRQPKTWTFRTR